MGDKVKAAAVRQVQRFTGCGRLAAESLVSSLAADVAADVAALADDNSPAARDRLTALVSPAVHRQQAATAASDAQAAEGDAQAAEGGRGVAEG